MWADEEGGVQTMAIPQNGEDMNMQVALDATSCLFLRGLSNYCLIDMPVGAVKPPHLPLKPIDPTGGKITHWFV